MESRKKQGGRAFGGSAAFLSCSLCSIFGKAQAATPARCNLLILGAYMFKSKILWALVLGVVTSVLLREAKINLAYSPLWSRIPHVLTAPGTRLVAAINMPGTLMEGSTRFWAVLAFSCNLLIYMIFWYVLLRMIGYFRGRQNPYERQNTTITR
jgi:hypothetical protein